MNPSVCTCPKVKPVNPLAKSELFIKPELSKSLPKRDGDTAREGESDNIEEEGHNLLKASFGNLPKSVLKSDDKIVDVVCGDFCEKLSGEKQRELIE
jgi:hypothetical protein